MVKTVRLKRGLDISIAGAAPWDRPQALTPCTCTVYPADYPGITPKVDVKEGDTVDMGTPLIHDKSFPDIRVVSPVKGTVKAVVRGERRKLLRIVIVPEGGAVPVGSYTGVKASDRSTAQQMLLDSGLWAMLRQRPYGIVPRPGVMPRDIFVTAFDSSPLAPDIEAIAGACKETLAAGIGLLSKLTDGAIHLGIRPGSSLADLPGVTVTAYDGPHPAGNPGVQIASVNPVNKGDTVWTLDIVTLMRIGRLAKEGVVDMTATVAVTGCEVKTPRYVSTLPGADMRSLLEGALYDDHVHHRIISGNVLTGTPETLGDGALHWPWTQVTVIPEGDDCHDFMGWASMSPQKMSVNRSFPGHFTKRVFCPDARILGGRRAMIMSGIYDRMLPMDVMVEYLVKACLSRNIERMEQLGIYEVVPEDVALCEYVDPSKLELQRIIAGGIDYMLSETE